jgi:hypothetical protein
LVVTNWTIHSTQTELQHLLRQRRGRCPVVEAQMRSSG